LTAEILNILIKQFLKMQSKSTIGSYSREMWILIDISNHRSSRIGGGLAGRQGETSRPRQLHAPLSQVKFIRSEAQSSPIRYDSATSLGQWAARATRAKKPRRRSAPHPINRLVRSAPELFIAARTAGKPKVAAYLRAKREGKL
jgi:hypothetical protein